MFSLLLASNDTSPAASHSVFLVTAGVCVCVSACAKVLVVSVGVYQSETFSHGCDTGSSHAAFWQVKALLLSLRSICQYTVCASVCVSLLQEHVGVLCAHVKMHT